jgi:hypothetical protein
MSRRAYAQMDAEMYGRAVRMLAQLAQDAFAPEAAKPLGQLIGACVAARPAVGLPVFAKMCLSKLTARGGVSAREVRGGERRIGIRC